MTVRQSLTEFPEGLTQGGVQTPTLQQVQDGKAGASYLFLGTGAAESIAIPHSSKLEIGTSDFTILSTGAMKRDNSGLNLWFYKEIGAANYGLGVAITTRLPTLYVRDSGGNNQNVVGVEPIPLEAVTTLVGVRDSAGTRMFVNGKQSGANTTSPRRDTTMGAGPLYVGYPSPTIAIIGQSFRNILFNYALSAEKIARYSAGSKLDFEDLGGSMNTKVNNGTFASATGWTISGTGSSVIGNLATFGYGTDVSLTQLSANWITGYTAGKRYRVTYTVVSNNLTGSPVFQLGNNYYTGGEVLGSSQVNLPMTPGTWSVEFTCDNIAGVTAFRMFLRGVTTAGSMVIQNLSVVQIGAIIDLEPENITDTMWVDSSPDGLHGTVSGAIANRFVPQYSTRNYVINGAMDFWQRATASSQIDSTIGDVFVADRFIWAVSGFSGGTGNQSLSRDTDVPSGLGLTYSLAHSVSTTLSGPRNSFIVHRIERGSIQHLLGKVVTVSFWAKATSAMTTTSAGVSVVSNDYSPSYTLDTTWRRFSFTTKITTLLGTNPTDSGLQIQLLNHVFSAGMTIKIAGIMLNEGPVAAPFERAGGSLGGELALCQRYYAKTYNLEVPPGTPGATTNALMRTLDATCLYASLQWTLPVTMRSNTFTVKVYNPTTGAPNSLRGDANDFASAAPSGSSGRCFTNVNNVNVGQNVQLSAHMTADAEI